ncbi:MAG: tripartite tricarboxylate transporter substrate binding protein [Burkholderiales bacterium]|nr:tripartite tricarboxylate transporter substrate binding protein [Burkholderiales bacterium]
MLRLIAILRVALLCFAAFSVQAAAWPDRPVKIIVPFPAGGPADSTCRILARRLGEIWHQPVIVENRPGAPGMVSAAAAPADGYTLLLGAGSNIVTGPLLNPKLAYKPQRDFVPIGQLLTNTPILVVHPGLGVKTLRELIIYAKKNPGALNYSSSGLGSPNHLIMEMFNNVTGTQMVHVPYKGSAPSVQELVAGHVQLAINATPSVLQFVRTGKLTGIAVASAKRDSALPDVPTMAEAGVPDFDYLIWYGLFAPSKTDKAIIEKIGAAMQKVLKEPEVVAQFKAAGADAAPASPQQFARIVKEDVAIWGKLIREKKLTLDE